MTPMTQLNSRPVRTSLAIAVAAVVLAACGDSSTTAAPTDPGDTPAEGSSVLATTSIWADVTQQVACGELEVPSIIPAGVDSHEFEPSVRDSDAVIGAQLVVANGLELEEGLVDTLAAAAEAGATVVPVAEGVTPIETGDDESHDTKDDGSRDTGDHSHDTEDGHAHDEGDGHAHDEKDAQSGEEGHAHAHDGADPHVWMDPRRVAEAVPTIAAALIEVADTGLTPEQIEGCASDYVDELDGLTAELTEMFSSMLPQERRLVTDHESLGYLAAGFDLEVIGTVIPSTSSLGEANPRELEELAETMEAAGVSRIYAASTGASDVANALGDRAGAGAEVQVVELYTESLGEPGGGADSYLSMMRTNGERISGP